MRIATPYPNVLGQPTFERAGIVDDTSLVLEAIRDARTKVFEFCGHECNVNSLRLQTFACCSLECPVCGLRAAFFAVERHVHPSLSPQFHLNLYGVDGDGRHVMFTHDHIMPKALGGSNTILNTQTMCYQCNQRKGHSWDGVSGVSIEKEQMWTKKVRQDMRARLYRERAAMGLF